MQDWWGLRPGGGVGREVGGEGRGGEGRGGEGRGGEGRGGEGRRKEDKLFSTNSLYEWHGHKERTGALSQSLLWCGVLVVARKVIYLEPLDVLVGTMRVRE